MPEIKDGTFKIKGKGTLDIIYEGYFIYVGYFPEEQQLTEIENLENVGVVTKNIVSSKGISLASNWYPSFEGMTNWNLKALLPKGFKAISEADKVEVADTGQASEYAFHFPYPLRQIHLVAGPYTEQHERYQGIELYTYFFPDLAAEILALGDAALAGRLASARREMGAKVDARSEEAQRKPPDLLGK